MNELLQVLSINCISLILLEEFLIFILFAKSTQQFHRSAVLCEVLKVTSVHIDANDKGVVNIKSVEENTL